MTPMRLMETRGGHTLAASKLPLFQSRGQGELASIKTLASRQSRRKIAIAHRPGPRLDLRGRIRLLFTLLNTVGATPHTAASFCGDSAVCVHLSTVSATAHRCRPAQRVHSWTLRHRDQPRRCQETHKRHQRVARRW